MKKQHPLAASLALAVVARSCAASIPAAAAGSAPATQVRVAAPTAEGHDWSYSGPNGPDHWGEIAPSCTANPTSAQSPINIDTTQLTESRTVVEPSIRYRATNFASTNNGHTVEAAPTGGKNTVVIDGTTFTLARLHVHAPSEHEINGKLAAMELHLVNKSADGRLAVLGVLFEVGAENKQLAEFFQTLQAAEHASATLSTQINPAQLIPGDADVVRYTGSLTTPPCSEGVLWNVADKPATLSQSQLDAFTAIISANNRPVQPLNDRRVFEAQD